jgi:hypothetical protein
MSAGPAIADLFLPLAGVDAVIGGGQVGRRRRAGFAARQAQRPPGLGAAGMRRRIARTELAATPLAIAQKSCWPCAPQTPHFSTIDRAQTTDVAGSCSLGAHSLVRPAGARQVFRGAKTDRAQLRRALAIMIPWASRINRSQGWPDA